MSASARRSSSGTLFPSLRTLRGDVQPGFPVSIEKNIHLDPGLMVPDIFGHLGPDAIMEFAGGTA